VLLTEATMRMWGLVTSLLILVAAASAQRKNEDLPDRNHSFDPEARSKWTFLHEGHDAPLRSDAFKYDVSVQMADTVLVGRYQSAIDYLPALGPKAAQWSLYRQVSHVLEGPLYRGFRIEYCESP